MSCRRGISCARLGLPPPPDGAKLVLGAVAEMPVNGAHDLLAAYREFGIRRIAVHCHVRKAVADSQKIQLEGERSSGKR